MSVELPDREEGPPLSPWPVLAVGLGLIGLGWQWGYLADGTAPAMRALTLALGLVAVGSALALYLPHAAANLEGRLMSAGLWLLGAASVYLARIGLGTQFDSMNVLAFVLTLAAMSAAVLSALPQGWRLLAASMLILLHFATILTAVTVVPPPDGNAPYTSNHVWHRFSRPWLQLTNLNNGYHFYAPDPGPAQLLFFRVEFDDGAAAWVRVPDHKTVTSHIERRRQGALASSCGHTNPVQPDRLEELRVDRLRAGREKRIPMSDLPPQAQYREPTGYVTKLLSSYVRHLAKTAEHPDGGSAAVKLVKVYRVDYVSPSPQHIQAGRDPFDPTLYLAFIMGEYDTKGELTPANFRTIGPEKEGGKPRTVNEPLLYWQLPIIRVPELVAEGEPEPKPGEGRVINYMRIHAGDKTELESIP